MIRPRKILLIITALGFWMILFYIIVTNKTTQQESHRKEVHKRLEELENRAEAVVSDYWIVLNMTSCFYVHKKVYVVITIY